LTLIALQEQVVRDLLTVRELLATKGWTKNAYVDDEGRYCLSGAIEHVTGGNYYRQSPRWLEVRHFVDIVLGVPWEWESAADWNDAPERHLRSVLNCLESAARIASTEKK
jgi:hypothetical protein